MGLIQSLLFRPPRPAQYTADNLNAKLHFTVTRSGNRIPVAVNDPGVLKSSNDGVPWIFFCHGNAEDLSNTTLWTFFMSNVLTIPIISYDYSGYGLSDRAFPTKDSIPLEPSPEYFLADAEAALLFAENHLGLKRENAILWGRSLGCSACCHLVKITKECGRNFGGCLLQAPFTSVVETLAMDHLDNPPSFDTFRNYATIKSIGGFYMPTFVVHGKADWVVRWWHGQEMNSLIPEEFRWPPLFHETSGHNDLESTCENFVQEVEEFINFCRLRLSD